MMGGGCRKKLWERKSPEIDKREKFP